MKIDTSIFDIIEKMKKENIKLKKENIFFRTIIQEVLDFGRIYYFRKKTLNKLGLKGIKLIKRGRTSSSTIRRGR